MQPIVLNALNLSVAAGSNCSEMAVNDQEKIKTALRILCNRWCHSAVQAYRTKILLIKSENSVPPGQEKHANKTRPLNSVNSQLNYSLLINCPKFVATEFKRELLLTA